MMQALGGAHGRRGESGARRAAGLCRRLALAWAVAAVPTVGLGQDKPDHFAAWVAIAQPEPFELQVAEGRWETVVRFRPERMFMLGEGAVDLAKGKTLLAPGTLMIGMAGRPNLACQFERPRSDYFIGCVEDKDGDGRFETYFDLNHGNPFLFSAFRQPRAKDRAIHPLSLSPAAVAPSPASMVLLYEARAGLTGNSRFELCVLREGVDNLWGDKTVARGCLPAITLGDRDYPREVSVYGRTVTFLSRDAGGVRVIVSGAKTDLPARL